LALPTTPAAIIPTFQRLDFHVGRDRFADRGDGASAAAEASPPMCCVLCKYPHVTGTNLRHLIERAVNEPHRPACVVPQANNAGFRRF
jgi:hypothetical protein